MLWRCVCDGPIVRAPCCSTYKLNIFVEICLSNLITDAMLVSNVQVKQVQPLCSL